MERVDEDRAKGRPLVTKRPVNKHGVRLCSSRILTISDTLFVIYELTGTPMAPHLSFRLLYDVWSTCVVFFCHTKDKLSVVLSRLFIMLLC